MPVLGVPVGGSALAWITPEAVILEEVRRTDGGLRYAITQLPWSERGVPSASVSPITPST